MNPNLEHVKTAFKSRGLKFAERDDRPILYISVKANHAIFLIIIHADDQAIDIFVPCPITVPDATRSAVAELVTRINCFTCGRLALSDETDLLQSRSKIKTDRVSFCRNEFFEVLFTAVGILDLALPAVIAVTLGGSSPTEALLAIRFPIVPPRTYHPDPRRTLDDFLSDN